MGGKEISKETQREEIEMETKKPKEEERTIGRDAEQEKGKTERGESKQDRRKRRVGGGREGGNLREKSSAEKESIRKYM